jgi:glycerol dehydrogenase-like iron-containing ADH family enzyme
MELPKYIVIGEALEETVAHRVRFNGFRRCLMVTSKTPLKVFGEKILSALDGDISCEVCFVDEVVENFDRYVSGARSFDVVLGVGGEGLPMSPNPSQNTPANSSSAYQLLPRTTA